MNNAFEKNVGLPANTILCYDENNVKIDGSDMSTESEITMDSGK